MVKKCSPNARLHFAWPLSTRTCATHPLVGPLLTTTPETERTQPNDCDEGDHDDNHNEDADEGKDEDTGSGCTIMTTTTTPAAAAMAVMKTAR